MPLREDNTIRQLEIKLKDQNSIYFKGISGSTRMDQLTDGEYKDDNGVVSPEPINVWEMITNGSLKLCDKEWNECMDEYARMPDFRIMDLWNDDEEFENNLTYHGEDGDEFDSDDYGEPTSLKLWGKKEATFNLPLVFPEDIGEKKKKKSKKKKKKKSKKKKKPIKKKDKPKSKKKRLKSKSRRR